MTIGDRVKNLIKTRGISRKKFYQSIGKTSGWLSQVKRGKTIPSPSTIRAMESVYKIDLETGKDAEPATMSDGRQRHMTPHCPKTSVRFLRPCGIS